MSKLIDELAAQRARQLLDYNENPAPENGRLQVRVDPEVTHLVNRLAIIMGCKRAEIISLAVQELAETINPDLL